MANTRTLLVDDDAGLCDLVREYLEGHEFQVDVAGDGEEGLRRAHSGQYELVVLDVMLPDITGFDVLRQIRGGELASLPVVMLTAHGDEVDRIVGLELGADDYLPKPFNPRELLARIRAVLRRSTDKSSPGSDIRQKLVSGDLSMDVDARQVWVEDHTVDVTATEFDLLHELMKFEGRVLQRDDLARQALGRRLLPMDRSLDLHMSKLRRKLGPASGGGERIRTVRGVGFVLNRPGENA
jgi:two-component system response regulator CpxR